jgi:septum formation topological specificity factor MinE
MSIPNIRRASTNKLAFMRDAKRKNSQANAPTKLDVKVAEDEAKTPHRESIKDEILSMMSKIKPISTEYLTLKSILKYLDDYGHITEKQSRILSKLYLDAYDNNLTKK